jgi:hypothetical protein
MLRWCAPSSFLSLDLGLCSLPLHTLPGSLARLPIFEGNLWRPSAAIPENAPLWTSKDWDGTMDTYQLNPLQSTYNCNNSECGTNACSGVLCYGIKKFTGCTFGSKKCLPITSLNDTFIANDEVAAVDSGNCSKSPATKDANTLA